MNYVMVNVIDKTTNNWLGTQLLTVEDFVSKYVKGSIKRAQKAYLLYV